jgi:methylmalonyl-CoA/ethylmalonyl-CoA epimerase
MSSGYQFDHIAFGVPEIAAATPFLVGALGGEPMNGGPGRGFRAFQWRYRGGGVIEVLEPSGPPGGFMHRFLEARGPGIHHVTFKVADLDAACARAEATGYGIVGYDASDPAWQEAFLHPRQAQGIVVQLAHSDPRAAGAWGSEPAPPAPPPAALRAEVVGLRLRVASEERARRQWGEVLGGEERRAAGLLLYTWPGSPMRIAVEVDGAGPEGPLGVEVRGAAKGVLPAGDQPALGGRFLPVG